MLILLQLSCRWINFEKIVDTLVAQNTHHIDIKKLQTLARDVCFIVDEQEFFNIVCNIVCNILENYLSKNTCIFR